jgi:putative membrane protein
MKRFAYFILLLAVLILGLSFAYKNSQIVSLSYYFGIHWDSPLSLMLLTALALGVVLGVLASLGMLVRMQRQLVRARREIRDYEQELMNLRALPIKDVL